MRCLCNGRSKSYIVTTVKTPSQSKISIGKVVKNSIQNGFDANASGVNGHAPTNTVPTNDIETPITNTTEVQIHNNHNDDVTRYQDTSQTVAQEFTSVSTSKNSTPEGTLTKKPRAPQPTKSQVITNNNSESQVTSLKGSESRSTHISGSNVTNQKSSESHLTTSNNIPEHRAAPPESHVKPRKKTLESELIHHDNISESQQISHNNSEIQMTFVKGSKDNSATSHNQKSSENQILTSSNTLERQVTSHTHIETHVASPETLEIQGKSPQTSEDKITIQKAPEDQLISHNILENHKISPKTSINQEVSYTTLENDVTPTKTSESNVSSHNISENYLATSETSSVIKSSHTSIKVTTKETANYASSIDDTFKSETSLVITEPVTVENIMTSSEKESSLNTVPVTEETIIHTSSTVNGFTSDLVTSPVTETTTHTSSLGDQKLEISLVTIPVTETTIVNGPKSEITLSTVHSTQEAAVTVSSNLETSGEITTTYTSQTLTETSLLSVPSPTNTISKSSSMSSIVDVTASTTHMSLESEESLDNFENGRKESVGELLAGSNRSSSSVETVVRRRSGVQVSALTDPEVTSEEEFPVFKKSPEDVQKIRKAIEKNEFLNKILSGKRLEDIINAMQPKNVIAKQKLIKQGENGSEMFVSKEGSFKILIKGKVVGEFNDSRVFGELAILYTAKRLASIQAASTGKVWVLDRQVYRKIVISKNLQEQDENLQFLKNVKSLNVVDVEVLRQVSNLLKTEFFVAGTVIIRQGDKGDKFYIIRAGTVAISKTGEGVLGKLGKGQCFGEMALQKEDTRQATVTAEAPGVECLTLTRGNFINHFGDVEIPKIEVKKTSFRGDAPSEYQDIKLDDLKILKTLGVGGFGRVELVQHKKKKDLIFALKYLKKIDIVYQNQQEHVYNEKLIQMNSRSPFIVSLYRTYKDTKYVYFLMESCLGGDLFSLLHRQKGKRFDEKDARFLSACVLEALEHLHSKGVVYRDLKPENLLIDKNGYLKLTDFGFAKKMPARGKTFTFAGTPEYVAPEIVLNRGHDKAVDYWAFGAFIFELLTGRTPFRTGDISHMRTYNKILNGIDNVNFPTYMNPKARNLIEKLCRPVPAERMGMQRGGTKDIKAHKWYQGFEWTRFQQCQIPSPFKPKLRDLTDTSNFDLFKQDKDYPPDETSGWDIHF